MHKTEDIDHFSPLAPPSETTPDWFPDLGSVSPAFIFRFVPVPDVEPEPPEYVYLKPPAGRKLQRLKFDLTITNWNSMWEAGAFTPRVVNRKQFPKQLRWLLKLKDRNLRLVPGFPKNRYDAYAPLYHLLPQDVLRAVGLPLLKRGLWPHWTDRHHLLDAHVPLDFDARLAEAFSRHVRPLLNSRSRRFAFSDREPIRVLSHHLDFWLPYVDVVAQRRMRQNGRCEPDDDDETFERDLKGSMTRIRTPALKRTGHCAEVPPGWSRTRRGRPPRSLSRPLTNMVHCAASLMR